MPRPFERARLRALLVAVLVTAGLMCGIAGAAAAPTPDPLGTPTPASAGPETNWEIPASPTPTPTPSSAPVASPTPTPTSAGTGKDDLCARISIRAIKDSCETLRAGADAVAHKASAVAGAITDPVGTLTRSGLQGLVDAVTTAARDYLQVLTKVLFATSTYNPIGPWFVHQYAIAFGLGLMLMSLILILEVGRAMGSGDHDAGELFRVVFARFPLAFYAAAFAPAIAKVATDVIDEATGQVLGLGQDQVAHFVAQLAVLFGRADPSTVGGLFTLLFFGFITAVFALLLWAEMLLRSVGLYLVELFFSWGFALWIRRRSARAASVPFVMWGGLLISKLVLALVLTLIAAMVTSGGFSDLGTGNLATLLEGAVALALALWALPVLLRFVPSLIGDIETGRAAVYARGQLVRQSRKPGKAAGQAAVLAASGGSSGALAQVVTARIARSQQNGKASRTGGVGRPGGSAGGPAADRDTASAPRTASMRRGGSA